MPNNPTIVVRLDGAELDGSLQIPEHPIATAIVTDGVPGGPIHPLLDRLSEELVRLGFAVVSADVLTPRESQLDTRGRGIRISVPLLISRLKALAAVAEREKALTGLPAVLVCSGAASAAAISLAVRQPSRFAAIASVDGRPDLAWRDLRWITAPVLIASDWSNAVQLDLNEEAYRRIRYAPKALETYAADDPQAMQRVATWLLDQIGRQG
jgi:hypothetical protein